MSKVSYKRKDYVMKFVYYKTNINGKVSFAKHINFELTDEAAEESARKYCVWSKHPSFFILGVKTIRW